MQSARGHCGKISNIYNAYLNPWFQRVVELNVQERQQLALLFADLSSNDSEILKLLDQTTSGLANAATTVVDLFEQGKLDEGNQLISSYRKQLLPVRRALSATMAKLQDLEADFIAMSGVA